MSCKFRIPDISATMHQREYLLMFSKKNRLMDFRQDVIERSHQLPVLVDFWAPWCGPCRMIGPLLEQLADEQHDRWILIKVNTEEEPDLALTYRIMSIPAVKLFYRGEVVNEFTGALTRTQVVDWLSRTLPTRGRVALDQLLDAPDVPAAEDIHDLLRQFPEEAGIRLLLAERLLWQDTIAALACLAPIKEGQRHFDQAKALRDVGEFLLLDTDDADITLLQDQLRNADQESAIAHALERLSRDPKILQGRLCRAMIGLFNTLGHQHPLSKAYRPKLNMLLWA